jgi:hypothetical protein
MASPETRRKQAAPVKYDSEGKPILSRAPKSPSTNSEGKPTPINS